MAYDGDKLSLMVQGRGTAKRWWMYQSADAIATVRAAGYISDATTRGMVAQDLVLVVDTNVPTVQWCLVIAITAGAADLSDGTVIAQTNT